MTMQLLIAEDESGIAKAVAYAARMTWPDCQTRIASTGGEALALFEALQPDLVVLDVELPGLDGFEICRRIRETSTVPILMLTVRTHIEDKVRALDLGADDFLTKPFDHLELLARLRALLRRAQGSARGSGTLLTVRDVTLNLATHEAAVSGSPIVLTTTEYRLLEVLMQHAGTALPHQYLLHEVWGPEYHGEVQYLRVFVRRLRQKLGDDGEQPRYIQTVWNTGYRFIPGQ